MDVAEDLDLDAGQFDAAELAANGATLSVADRLGDLPGESPLDGGCAVRGRGQVEVCTVYENALECERGASARRPVQMRPGQSFADELKRISVRVGKHLATVPHASHPSPGASGSCRARSYNPCYGG